MPGTTGGEWVVYLRLSKGRAGIPRQRRATVAWIEAQGGTVAGEFLDKDSTAFQKFGGEQPQRAGFDAMLAEVRARPGLNVGAYHADRLSRNQEDSERILSTTAKAGGLIGTPGSGIYDPSTATGRSNFRRDVVSAIAEVDHMRERIVLMKDEARAAGHWLGGPRTFGWQRGRAPRDGGPPAQVLVPIEADCIAAGTRAINAGASLSSVRRAWHAAGVTGTKGSPFTNREVSAILCRARNAGLAEYDFGDGRGLQVTGAGAWPAIVTEDEWANCKTILTNPGRRTQRGTQASHLLSGIAVCGAPGCGVPVVATSANRGRGRPRQVVYRDRPKEGKGHVARAAAPLNHYISEAVIAYVEKHGQKALQPRAPDTAPLAAQLKAVEAELASIDAGRADESITVAQAIQWARPLNRRAAELRDRITAASAARAHAAIFTEADIRAGWERAPLDAKRAVVRALMTITILPVPAGQHGCPPGWRRGDGPYFRPELVKVEWIPGTPPSS